MKKYTIKEFIEKTKNEPLKWINYCEVLITPGGRIVIANPSHAIAAENYVCEYCGANKEKMREEMLKTHSLQLEFIIARYRLVAIWFTGYLYGYKGLTKLQQRSINKLIENNLITKHNPYIRGDASDK